MRAATLLLLGVGLERAADDGEHNLELSIVGRGRVRHGAVLREQVLRLLAIVDEERHVAAVVDDEVRAVALAIDRERDRVERALPVLLE